MTPGTCFFCFLCGKQYQRCFTLHWLDSVRTKQPDWAIPISNGFRISTTFMQFDLEIALTPTQIYNRLLSVCHNHEFWAFPVPCFSWIVTKCSKANITTELLSRQESWIFDTYKQVASTWTRLHMCWELWRPRRSTMVRRIKCTLCDVTTIVSPVTITPLCFSCNFHWGSKKICENDTSRLSRPMSEQSTSSKCPPTREKKLDPRTDDTNLIIRWCIRTSWKVRRVLKKVSKLRRPLHNFTKYTTSAAESDPRYYTFPTNILYMYLQFVVLYCDQPSLMFLRVATSGAGLVSGCVAVCNDHPASTSEMLKFKGLDFDDFDHITLIASVSLKKTWQLNQRGLERHSAKPGPTERRRQKSELRKPKVYSNLLITPTRTFVSTGAFVSWY